MQGQITVRLPKDLESRLEAFARERGLRRSEVVRDALRRYLEGPAVGAGRPYERVKELLGSASGGPPDLAARHREYLQEILGAR